MFNLDGVIAALHSADRPETQRTGLDSQERFIADLDYALMRQTEPKDIVAVTVRMLAQYTGADRCDYAEIEADEDHSVVLDDSAGGGAVCVPVTRADHLVAGMALLYGTPHRWSSQEIDLIDTVANRCRESIERVTALRHWKASYEDYRSFIAISSEGIWRFEIEQPIPITLPVDDQIDLLYRYAYLAESNNAMARMYGYDSVEQILGARLDDLMPQSNPRNVEYLRALHASGYHLNDVESSELDRFGNAKVFLNSASAIVENGMIVRAWGTQRDITAQKQAEVERARLSGQIEGERDRLRRILEQMPIGVAITEAPSGRLLFHNIEALRLLHRPSLAADDYKSYAKHGALHEDGRPYEAEEYPGARSLMSGEIVKDEEIRARLEDGSESYFSVNSAPIYDADGRMALAIVTFMDIAERKRLLLQEQEAREEAEAANRMKDEFLATVSHELRTPLTAILGWASMLNRGLLSPCQTQRAVQVIEQSARSQAGLVDDILDTARIITGRLRLDAHPVEIARILQAAIDVIRPSADAKRIAIQIVIDAPDAVVFGDANRVQQVIWNLLSNAVKFTSEGGRIEARVSRSEGHVDLTITDTGVGIEPQFLPYVFDRFRQADSTSTRQHSGLGLGLAIVRHVVELHGGTVAASSPGKGLGATFTVQFPVASPESLQQPATQPQKPESKRPAQPGHVDDRQNLDGVRVLVVEDDVDTLEMVRVILRNRGAEVITAPSAGDALEALEHSVPDALVSDLAMPDQDGYELIEHIRQRTPEQGGNVPAVALTAYARVEDRVRALTAGFQMYVPKPVDPDELVAVVANLTHLATSGGACDGWSRRRARR